MHWLAIHCPTLSLDGVLRRWPDGVEPALAITDLDGTRRFIAVATRATSEAGVFAGQAVATALAMLPSLVLLPRDPDAERSALHEVALALLRFTPIVSLRATGVLLEISGSLKLFGGRRVLRRQVAETVHGQGLAMAIAEAPTPHGAWLLAKEKARRKLHPPKPGRELRHDSFAAALDALPLLHLDATAPYLDRFEGISCRTFGGLRRLPAKGLARRFGPALLDEMARAIGDRPDPQILFEAPSRFDARIELMARIEHAEALVFASQRLLAQLAGWLAARRAAVRGFTLMLHHDRWTRDAIPPTAIDIALATPSGDLLRFVALLRERLPRIELTAPVLELSLAAPAIVESEECDGALFPARAQAFETLARLIEKLTARLGPEAAARIERVADHRPERAWREVRGEEAWRTPSAIPASKPRSGLRSLRDQDGRIRLGHADAVRTRVTRGSIGPRPSWLFDEPQVLEVRGNRPAFETPLDLVAGPERIETGWWDDATVTRDYYIAENAAGRLLWIYKERLPRPGKPTWYLQGLFG